MQHNNKNDKIPSTFVDGVPVKISEQYKPPRKIILPFSCQNSSPSELLFTEYDFRLENGVISKLTEWKKMRDEEKGRRKERLKGAKEVRQDLENIYNVSLGEIDGVVEGMDSTRQACKLDDSILIPVSAKANSPREKPTSSLFNISDFESDNSSPFDNMELKTINDMEVLASILTPDNLKQSFNNNCNIVDKELNKNGFSLSKTNERSQGPVNGYDNLVLSSFNASLIPKSYVDRYGPVNSVSENYQFCNYELNNFLNQRGGVVPGPSVKQMETHHRGNLVQDASFRSADLSSQKTNSKSVPDIVNELNKELEESKKRDILAERKIRTPPLSSVEPKLPETAKGGKKQSSRLPDPTSNLKPELLRLAHHISEMGFPLARVSRACESFGGDSKKAIEFLLQVQSIEEKNYPGDLVERALHANDFQTEKTINYLNSMMVLLDLGFEERKVEEALLKTNSDRDKALDLLIS